MILTKKLSRYHFQSPEEIFAILPKLVSEFPSLAAVEMGVSELMLNAVEHGNLGISYQEKSQFMKNGGIQDEIQKRLAEPAYQDRQAYVEVRAEQDEVVVLIVDQGEGFDWKLYLNRDLADVTGMHGRGMMLSAAIFKTLTYVGNGNKVVAVVDIASADQN